MASGTVFNDANGNGQRDPDEKGLAGVGVSNGEAIVETDADGRWQLPVTDDTILFVLKPSGWMTPVNTTTFTPIQKRLILKAFCLIIQSLLFNG